jgi:hypothetical protein
MRGRPALVMTLALLAGCTLAGCGGSFGGDRVAAKPTSAGSTQRAQSEPPPSAQSTPSPPPVEPTRVVPPAAAAGGACTLLTYDGVAAATGVRFDVAASTGTPGREQVCVLQRADAGLPDLTLTVLSTTADPESFGLDFQPKDAQTLPGIGRAAYSQVTPSSQAGRPSAEIGWLGKKKLYTLTYTSSQGTSPARLQKAAAGLAKLARALSA